MFSLSGTIWFIIILFGGAILLAICKGIIDGIGAPTFFLLISVIVAIVGAVLMANGNKYGIYVLLLGVILTIVLIAVFVHAVRKVNEQKSMDDIAKKEEERKRNLRAFYEQCQEAGVDSLSTESQKQRAVLFAREHGLDERNVEAILREQRLAIAQEARDAKAKEMKDALGEKDKARKEKYDRDAAEQKKMKTPYPHFGQEKRAAVWQEKIDACEEIIKSLTQEIDSLQQKRERIVGNAKFESKMDWAVAGGIGSAIGGAGAGVMAALEAQAENARVDQRNEAKAVQLLEYAKNSIILQQKAEAKKYEQEKMVREYKNEILVIRRKLVEAVDGDKLLDVLRISEATATPTQFSITVALKKKAMIFGDVPAVFDGTFWAHIYQEKEYVGSVRVVLPYEGVDTKKTVLTFDTSLGIDVKKPCYIEYEAEKIWFIEK